MNIVTQKHCTRNQQVPNLIVAHYSVLSTLALVKPLSPSMSDCVWFKGPLGT